VRRARPNLLLATALKQLIINGDDFGVSAEVNEGILRCHRHGILTSTSMMVAGKAAAAGAAAARDCPELDVGLHLVVCMGHSVLPKARLRGLVDGANCFGNNPVAAGMRYFFDRRVRGPLTDEVRAQIERHLQLVGYLNHIDGHLNFHVHPVLFDILIDLAEEYRVPCIRLPRERLFTTLRLSRDHGGRKVVEAVIFRLLSARARRKMDERGLKSTDWLYGLHQSGNMSAAYFQAVLNRLPKGATEIYFHPAQAGSSGGPPAQGQREVDILTDPRLPGLLARENIQLTTYSALAQAFAPLRAANAD